MILSAQTIRKYCLEAHPPLVSPFHERTTNKGMSYGLSTAGYDVRCKQDVCLEPAQFVLASTIEKFCLPNDIIAVVHDKSTLARRGLSVFNTLVESGWSGWLTLELKNQGSERIVLEAGTPVAQMVFHYLDHTSEMPYRGKYQDQPDRPVPAILS